MMWRQINRAGRMSAVSRSDEIPDTLMLSQFTDFFEDAMQKIRCGSQTYVHVLSLSSLQLVIFSVVFLNALTLLISWLVDQ